MPTSRVQGTLAPGGLGGIPSFPAKQTSSPRRCRLRQLTSSESVIWAVLVLVRAPRKGNTSPGTKAIDLNYYHLPVRRRLVAMVSAPGRHAWRAPSWPQLRLIAGLSRDMDTSCRLLGENFGIIKRASLHACEHHGEIKLLGT